MESTAAHLDIPPRFFSPCVPHPWTFRPVNRACRRTLGRRNNHFSYVADTICSRRDFTFKLIVSLTRALKTGTPRQIRSNEIYLERTTTKQTVSDNLSPPSAAIYIEQGTAMIAFGIHLVGVLSIQGNQQTKYCLESTALEGSVAGRRSVAEIRRSNVFA